MDTKGGKRWGSGGGGVMNWENGIDMYTLMCIKWVTNKNLLYKKINKIKFKNSKKKTKKRLGSGPSPSHLPFPESDPWMWGRGRWGHMTWTLLDLCVPESPLLGIQGLAAEGHREGLMTLRQQIVGPPG